MDHVEIRALLAANGLSQRGAAKSLGINERTMRAYCSGEKKIPTLVKLAMRALTGGQATIADIPDKTQPTSETLMPVGDIQAYFKRAP
jgi:DNA-binding XRE family transcriptional regulator